jgi:diadenosine tetraphosphate (Ap4A) HIT family hydrolase
LLLRRFRFWRLYLHQKQYYLGRSYAWLVRDGAMQDITDVRAEEWRELFYGILPLYQRVLRSLWEPGLFNYKWLGNEIESHHGHGHMHIVPRYQKSFEHNGRWWHDERWGKNPDPEPVLDPPLAPLELRGLVGLLKGRLATPGGR